MSKDLEITESRSETIPDFQQSESRTEVDNGDAPIYRLPFGFAKRHSALFIKTDEKLCITLLSDCQYGGHFRSSSRS